MSVGMVFQVVDELIAPVNHNWTDPSAPLGRPEAQIGEWVSVNVIEACCNRVSGRPLTGSSGLAPTANADFAPAAGALSHIRGGSAAKNTRPSAVPAVRLPAVSLRTESPADARVCRAIALSAGPAAAAADLTSST